MTEVEGPDPAGPEVLDVTINFSANEKIKCFCFSCFRLGVCRTWCTRCSRLRLLSTPETRAWDMDVGTDHFIGQVTSRSASEGQGRVMRGGREVRIQVSH